ALTVDGAAFASCPSSPATVSAGPQPDSNSASPNHAHTDTFAMRSPRFHDGRRPGPVHDWRMLKLRQRCVRIRACVLYKRLSTMDIPVGTIRGRQWIRITVKVR